MESKWQAICAFLVSVLLARASGQGYRRGGTLYTAVDPLVQMNGASFTSNVYGKPHAWFVEFYASWCGHCQRFAPTWRRLAKDVKEWQSVIRLGAVACSLPSNTQLCSAHAVRRYPTVKFFPPNAPGDSKGTIFDEDKGLDVASLRHGMIDFLEGVRSKPASWPSFEPIPSLQESWIARSATTTKNLLFVEGATDNDTKYLSREVILDMSAFYPSLTIQRMTPQNAARYGVTMSPAMYTIDKDNRITELVRSNDRGRIVSLLRQMMTNVTTTTAVFTTTTMATVTSSQIKPDKVYMQDLESHLRYSFWNEIGSKASLSANELQGLKYHMRILSKYHPGRAHVKRFINKVDDWLESVHGNLTGAQWISQLNKLQSEDAYIPDVIKWTGCAGSQARFRGYPCSVWVTFHVLTVNALEINMLNDNFSPLEVLLGMRSYVKNFFGCSECAEHFGVMAARLEQVVRHKGDAVMWLWKSHNKVNRRLHGDMTEDPANIKIQFPSYQNCPECHVTPTQTNQNIADWNEVHVLRYLRKLYNKYNIVQDVVSYTVTSKAVSVTTPVTTPTPTPSRQSDRCVPHTSQWTACSRTCGVGTSTRMTNQNRECETRKDVRLCQLRQCSQTMNHQQPNSSQCQATTSQGRPTALRYGTCVSLRRYRWYFCALCRGKTCLPMRSRTVWMVFSCTGLRRGYAKVQWIDWCHCH